MSSFFDDLARTLATPMPRRRALRAIGAATAVAALPALRPHPATGHTGSSTDTCPGLTCKSGTSGCCVSTGNGNFHLGGCCAPKATCCKGSDAAGEARSWCCEEDLTCGTWGTANQCTCPTRCKDGACCPRSKGRCVKGKCCPAIRTTFAPGTNKKGVACCPPGTIAVPGKIGYCCPRSNKRCCVVGPDADPSDDLTPLPQPVKLRKGELCINGGVFKGLA